MHDPANGLRRIPLPRPWVNKGKKKAEAARSPDPLVLRGPRYCYLLPSVSGPSAFAAARLSHGFRNSQLEISSSPVS